PLRTPKTSQPFAIPVRTTARMAAFMPGASPPLVRTAIFRVDIGDIPYTTAEAPRIALPWPGAREVLQSHARQTGHHRDQLHHPGRFQAVGRRADLSAHRQAPRGGGRAVR